MAFRAAPRSSTLLNGHATQWYTTASAGSSHQKLSPAGAASGFDGLLDAAAERVRLAPREATQLQRSPSTYSQGAKAHAAHQAAPRAAMLSAKHS